MIDFPKKKTNEKLLQALSKDQIWAQIMKERKKSNVVSKGSELES